MDFSRPFDSQETQYNLQDMINVVQSYIYMKKGVRVKIVIRLGTEHENFDLSLLERAFQHITRL